MTPMIGAGIDHSGASSCLLYPYLCPRCALKYCGSKSHPRYALLRKEVRRESSFFVGWGMASHWHYSRTTVHTNRVYLHWLLTLLITRRGQICSWKNKACVSSRPKPQVLTWMGILLMSFTKRWLPEELVSQLQWGLGDIPKVIWGNHLQSRDPWLVRVIKCHLLSLCSLL